MKRWMAAGRQSSRSRTKSE
uniref:Uncharacterized protein n=1 Tax=Arundo donax TaxID=35708 RepID=A0A0A9FT27_ARUDO